MSGVLDFVRPRRLPAGPIEKKLALEDNTRINRCLGAGQVTAAWIIAWALTTSTPFVPIDFVVDTGRKDVDRDSLKITFVIPDRKPADRRPVKRPPNQNHGRVASSRNPAKEAGRIQVKVIETLKRDGWADKVYATLKGIGHGVDQEKIENAARLTRTDPTRISGRPGVKREEYNQGYTDGDGKEDAFDISATSMPEGPLSNRLRGPGGDGPVAMKSSDIKVSSEERFRSSEEILAVVRSHSPGLRHIYNMHLKRQPGLGGKVTVRFAIAPSGLVVDAAIADGTTGSRGFEAEVLASIRSWRFEAIKALGNDIVTVPFNFSE